MNVLHFVGYIWFFYLIYNWFFKPVKTLEDVFKRGIYYSMLRLKRKERDLYLKALENDQYTPIEKRDISFALGMWFAKNGDCAKATSYFDQSFEDYEAVFYYKKEFNHVLDSYLACSQKEKAGEMLRFFLSRKSFDGKFSKLEKKYSFLL